MICAKLFKFYSITAKKINAFLITNLPHYPPLSLATTFTVSPERMDRLCNRIILTIGS